MYRVLTGIRPKEYANYYKHINFDIYFQDNKILSIGQFWRYAMYIEHKFSIKEDGFFKWLFNDGYLMRNRQEKDERFAEKKSEFDEYFNELKELRLNFIETFNQYKNY